MKNERSVSVPELLDFRAFHDVCHEMAKHVQPPDGFTEYELGQHIKGMILDRLASEYVTIEKYEGYRRLAAGGRHEFKKPVPREVFSEAARKAGLLA